MNGKRKQHTAEFRFKVALEALKGLKTVAELASIYEVHPTLINRWKKELHEGGRTIFGSPKRKGRETEVLQAALYEEIGRLKFELDWLKKKLPLSVEARRTMIELYHPRLSVRRQCELVGLNRSSVYYQPTCASPENLQLMRLMDEQYLKTPFYGSRRMTVWLNSRGLAVNRKRVQRLMRLMGLEAIYPRPQTSLAHPSHKISPYLLRDLAIIHPHQVWSTDITYIPMPQGFMYLVAIMDWYSRYVLFWRLSNTLEGSFCLEALEEALELGKPSIFNSDQGVQFTGLEFTGRLEAEGIAVSHDGRGRALDNVFVERLWRSVKYEDVYIKDYGSVVELETGLTEYFQLYNDHRPHQSLNYQTPASVHFQQVSMKIM